jgi:hypothetical protein
MRTPGRSHSWGFAIAVFFEAACGSQSPSQQDAGANSEAGPVASDASSLPETTAPTPDAGSQTPQSDSGTPAEDGAAPPGDAGLPPLDPTALISSLNDMQRGELCDWEFAKLGGYGKVTQCTGEAVSLQNPANQAACIKNALTFNCLVTVGDVETCTLARAPTDGCDSPPACDPVYCH